MTRPRAFKIAVTQTVEVVLDGEAFNEAFMQEFRDGFYDYYTIEEHAEHIAQLHARGIFDGGSWDEFIEGYGFAKEMGIRARVIDTEIEQVSA
jgi:hypothetical protein